MRRVEDLSGVSDETLAQQERERVDGCRGLGAEARDHYELWKMTRLAD